MHLKYELEFPTVDMQNKTKKKKLITDFKKLLENIKKFYLYT